MIEIRNHKNIFSLRKKWQAIETEGNVHVYQTFFYQSRVYMRLPLYLIPKRQIPVYFEICENDETKMIIPLCKTLFQNKYESLGNFNGLPFYDFVYSGAISEEQLICYVRSFLEYLKGSYVYIHKMDERGFTYQALQKNGLCSERTQENYVNIAFGNSYEEYFNGLSKNARQNIRKAYNHLKTDLLNMKFKIIYGEKIQQKLLNESIDIYCDRHLSRYHEKTSKLKRFYLKYFDFSTECLKKHRNNFWASMLINDKLAAFLAGYYDEINNCIDVRRISMSDKYSRYSPGLLIINETVKELIDRSHVKNLDLTIGDEDYKLYMGGQVYNSCNFVLKGIQNAGT